MAVAAGIDLRGNNPGPTNIAAGLSTIEEKSLGNITKSGSHPILDVLDYAEAPPNSGLYLMDAPAYAPESLTGFTAAGAQLHLFTTGVGNSFVSALSPTLKYPQIHIPWHGYHSRSISTQQRHCAASSQQTNSVTWPGTEC